ncbi:hypothetical protein B0H13DRAFT_2271792 [Mycena leptocephala]|nr:hypothetical protein B0H13DRAFT_2271792 [Mycena leptocephala]
MDAAKLEEEAKKKKKQTNQRRNKKSQERGSRAVPHPFPVLLLLLARRHEERAEGKGPGAGVRCTDELASLPLLVDGRSKRWCSWSSVRVLEGIVNALSASGAAPDEVEGAKETGIGVADRLEHGRRPEKDRRAKADAGGNATPTWSYFSLASSTAAVSAVTAGRCGRVNDLNNEKQDNEMRINMRMNEDIEMRTRRMGKEKDSREACWGCQGADIARPEIASTNSLRGMGKKRDTHPIKSALCSAFNPYYSPARRRARVLEERALQIESYAYTGGHVAAMVEAVVQTAGLGVPLLAADSAFDELDKEEESCWEAGLSLCQCWMVQASKKGFKDLGPARKEALWQCHAGLLYGCTPSISSPGISLVAVGPSWLAFSAISFDDGVRVDRGFRLIWLSVVSVVLFSS